MIASGWNEKHPIGTAVAYSSIIGGPVTALSKTRTVAFESESGTPVVMLEGKSGYVALEALLVKASDGRPDRHPAWRAG